MRQKCKAYFGGNKLNEKFMSMYKYANIHL